jgi:hypothetical protein
LSQDVPSPAALDWWTRLLALPLLNLGILCIGVGQAGSRPLVKLTVAGASKCLAGARCAGPFGVCPVGNAEVLCVPDRKAELDPENETGGFCNGAVHVKWFLFAAAQRAERLKIAFQAVDPPLVAVLCSEAVRPFFVLSPAFRIPGRAEGVKGPKR